MQIVSIYDNESLIKYSPYVDGVILYIPKLAITYFDLDLDNALDYLKDKNKIIILGINKIMHPNDLDMAINFINKYLNYNLLFYVSDIGLMKYARDNNISSRFIYNPETMITNGIDLNLYNEELKPKAISMSLEITIDDFMKATKDFKGNLFYPIFGTHLMFYSNRRLITLYEIKNKETYPKTNLYLRESTRSDLFPIIETEYGTAIYRGYLICYLKYLNELNLKYEYIESLYINSEVMIEALKCFNEYKRDLDYTKAINKINSLNLNIEDGFSINDSVYLKEELKL